MAATLTHDADVDPLINKLVGEAFEAVPPARSNRHGASRETLLARDEHIQT